ncbi:cation:proton antiporter [Chelativorans sp. AA-79]|uniref:cation:proton antiporter domain-containing protein n=1 Tax=Chelativorans sp. AA-79 TaxID=3028735 RepID=UPI0023F92795|nr:cation:proton antiporter [Chelativorans sp. AA-79]WEX11496.1 cation:proton antiporter [Chelativorans sp. AA-79]
MPHHQTELIAMVALGVVLAFGLGLIARFLRLPPLIGYLLAGIAIGPNTPGFIGDVGLAGQISELGVILLMFGVGLHFSLNDLLVVRRIAVPGAIIQIAGATAMGTVLTKAWGWDLSAGLVFGLALSVASTVVLLRALDEMNLLDSANGRIAVGWLVVEDIAMVLALVVLPAFAVPAGTNDPGAVGQAGATNLGFAIGLTLAKVGAFTALVLVVGRRVVPWLLKQAARAGSRELFTLAVLAIALGIACGSAELFGVSFALGAFFAGVVLSESELSHRAATESLPLQDAFAVLFFVSVGMLFDPSVLIRDPLAVIAVVLVIVVGKALAAAAIVVALGYPLPTAVIVSAALAQIGEFSFILAEFGVSLRLMPTEGRDLIIAGALLSISLNPFVFAVAKLAEPRLAKLRAGAGTSARADRLSGLDIEEHERKWADHVIVVGAGRVGRTVAAALRQAGVSHIVIERNRRRAEIFRDEGAPVIQGDAAAPGVFEAAGAERARLIAIAVPDGYEARRVLERAREINARVEILVRAHNDSDRLYLLSHGATRAILGEHNAGLAIAEATLSGLGLARAKATATVDALQQEQAKTADASGSSEEMHGAPELRPHQE